LLARDSRKNFLVDGQMKELEFFCISSIDISALEAFLYRITIYLYRFTVKRMVHLNPVMQYPLIYPLQ